MMNRLHTSSGFMLVEILVAAGVIGLAVLGLGAGLNKLAQSKTMTSGVSAALAFESGLLLVIQDPNSYTTAQKTLLNTGSAWPNLNFSIPMSASDGTAFTVNFPLDNNYHYYKDDGTYCTGCTSTGMDWFYRAKGRTRQIPGLPGNVYGIAYRIEFNSNRILLAELGSTNDPFVNSEDYKWLIPFEVYTDKLTTKRCDESIGQVIVTGIDRVTSEPRCLSIGDSSQCAPDEVATGWVLDTTPIPHIKMGCRRLNTTANCPTLSPGFDYVVLNVNPASATGTQMVGNCVFKAQKQETIPATTAPSSRVAVFEVCPQHYRFVPTGPEAGCTFTITNTFRGWQNIGCPSGSGVNWVQAINPTAMSISGAITAVGARANREVTCTLRRDFQQLWPMTWNWAGFAANITVNGTCELNDDEIKPLL